MRQILLLIILAISSALFATEGMVTIPTRQGVTQSYVLTTPDKVSPDVVLILFPGAQGKINLRKDNGQIKFGESNFLVRERQRFVDLGAATAVIDVPSDNRSGRLGCRMAPKSVCRKMPLIVLGAVKSSSYATTYRSWVTTSSFPSTEADPANLPPASEPISR
jgi:hypothetical protein